MSGISSIQHLVEIQAIHADDALASAECDKTVIGEAAVADEEPACPRGFLLNLTMKGVQLGDAYRLAMPLGFQQICVTAELEAAVDLFAPQSERFLGC